ncbi:hypothetical protein ACOME3_002102 [Neoechinorhynchus agilis]
MIVVLKTLSDLINSFLRLIKKVYLRIGLRNLLKSGWFLEQRSSKCLFVRYQIEHFHKNLLKIPLKLNFLNVKLISCSKGVKTFLMRFKNVSTRLSQVLRWVQL